MSTTSWEKKYSKLNLRIWQKKSLVSIKIPKKNDAKMKIFFYTWTMINLNLNYQKLFFLLFDYHRPFTRKPLELELWDIRKLRFPSLLNFLVTNLLKNWNLILRKKKKKIEHEKKTWNFVYVNGDLSVLAKHVIWHSRSVYMEKNNEKLW